MKHCIILLSLALTLSSMYQPISIAMESDSEDTPGQNSHEPGAGRDITSVDQSLKICHGPRVVIEHKSSTHVNLSTPQGIQALFALQKTLTTTEAALQSSLDPQQSQTTIWSWFTNCLPQLCTNSEEEHEQ